MITVKVDNADVLAALRTLRANVVNLAPAMSEIGEHMTTTTKQRFVTSRAPDGKRWQPNSRATIEAYIRGRGGYSSKTGSITKKGQALLANKKPLVASGILAHSIRWQLVNGRRGVAVGTNRFFDQWQSGAAVHQFGSRNKRIPARPFLGLSSDDVSTIIGVLTKHIEKGIP